MTGCNIIVVVIVDSIACEYERGTIIHRIRAVPVDMKEVREINQNACIYNIIIVPTIIATKKNTFERDEAPTGEIQKFIKVVNIH